MLEIQQLTGFNSVGKNKRKKQIVLTHTSRNVSDYISSLKNRYNGKYDKTPHFIIQKDGRVFQMIDPSFYSNILDSEQQKKIHDRIKELKKIDGVKVATPNGAFYCIVELPVLNTDDFAQWMLESFRLNNQTIMVAPAAGFYSTPGLGKNQIRIAYVLSKAELKNMIKLICLLMFSVT